MKNAIVPILLALVISLPYSLTGIGCREAGAQSPIALRESNTIRRMSSFEMAKRSMPTPRCVLPAAAQCAGR